MDVHHHDHAQPPVVYQPIRRIAIACISCRRKKARCTGTRPSCAACLRAGRDCKYPGQHWRQQAGSITVAHVTPGDNDGDEPAKSPADPEATQAQGHGGVSHRLDRIEWLLVNLRTELEKIALRLPSVDDAVAPVEAPLEQPSSDSGTGYTVASLTTVQHVAQAVLSNYFAFMHNQPFSLFHKNEMLRRHLQGSVAETLLFAVFSHGLRFPVSHFTEDQARQIARQSADHAWENLRPFYTASDDTPAEDPFLALQTVTLLSIFDFGEGPERHHLAWIKLRMAIYLAQDLQASEKLWHCDLPTAFQEERRHTIWSLYALERMVCCCRRRIAALGRLFHMPLPRSEAAWSDGNDDLPPTLGQVLDSRTPTDLRAISSTGLTVILFSLLGRCIEIMVQAEDCSEAPWDPRSEYCALRAQLIRVDADIDFSRDASDVLQEHRDQSQDQSVQQILSSYIFAKLICCTCHCLLAHPFLLRRLIKLNGNRCPRDFLSQVFPSAIAAACTALSSIAEAHRLGCLVVQQFTGYCCVIAGTILALESALTDDEDVRTQCGGLLSQTMDHLTFLAQFWSGSDNMRKLLEQFTNHVDEYAHILGRSPCTDDFDEEDKLLWALVDYEVMRCKPLNLE